MRRRHVATTLASSLLALVALTGTSAAQAPEAATAASYINPDLTSDAVNTDVDPGSSCATPDQSDTQLVGDPATGENNVHNDACLFDAAGNRIDVPAAFELSGPGAFSACPDPDKEGPKTSQKVGDACLLSGYEDANSEYHARIVGTAAGQVTVTFCADPEANGCADATVSDEIVLTFTAAGSPATPVVPAGPVAAGEAPAERGAPILPVVLVGAAALGASVLVRRRAS